MKWKSSLVLAMEVFAPTKTTTAVSLSCLGVKVERSAGSVQRAVEEALTEFGHCLRPALLKEARAARARAIAYSAPSDDNAPVKEPDESAGGLPDKFVLPAIGAPELQALVANVAIEDPGLDTVPLFPAEGVEAGEDGPLTPFEP